MINWGILGTGKIAAALAVAIGEAADSQVTAVGSRTLSSADEFADAHDIPNRYGSYLEACNDDSVDVIYVATTNDLHHRNTLDALGAGKAVLCEKPFALNRRQAAEMIEAANQSGLFLMEAMWTRFIPAVRAMMDLIGQGGIGEVKAVSADFGFVADLQPGSRLIDMQLGAGSLLDLGVYPISFAMMVLGEPIAVAATSHSTETGADLQTAFALKFPEGRVATGFSSFLVDSASEARVEGSQARLRVHSRFHHPTRFDVIYPDQSVEEHSHPYDGSGYRFEVEEVNRCVAAGKAESDIMPLSDTLAVIGVLDEVRRQIGLIYPQE